MYTYHVSVKLPLGTASDKIGLHPGVILETDSIYVYTRTRSKREAFKRAKDKYILCFGLDVTPTDAIYCWKSK